MEGKEKLKALEVQGESNKLYCCGYLGDHHTVISIERDPQGLLVPVSW